MLRKVLRWGVGFSRHPHCSSADAAIRRAVLEVLESRRLFTAAMPGDVRHDILTVPLDGSIASSTFVLQAGATYHLRGSGTTAYVDQPNGRRTDVEYYDYQTGTPLDLSSPNLGSVDVGLKLVGSGGAVIPGFHWGAYQSSHAYVKDFVGTGDALQVKYVDVPGFYYDNAGTLTFQIYEPVKVQQLSVTANGDPENRALATGTNAIDFYLTPDAGGSATIVIDGLIGPDHPDSKSMSLWKIDPHGNTASRTSGKFSNSLSVRTVTLTNGPSDDYTIVAGADKNENGVLETSEVERTIELHLSAPQTVVVGPEVINFRIGTLEPVSGGGSTFVASPYVPLNGDYDEQNRDGGGDPLPDNAGDASTAHYGGHRIRDVFGGGGFTDADLRDAELYLNPTITGPARWKINLPDNVKMWYWWPNGSRTRPGVAHWGLVVDDQFSLPDSMPQTYCFRIEGITPSTQNLITVTLVPEASNGQQFVNPGTPVSVVGADLDIDGDNDDGFGSPARGAAEEYNEDIPHALADPAETPVDGKVLALNRGDADGDGILDFADGYDRDGVAGNDDDVIGAAAAPFVPMVIDVADSVNLAASGPTRLRLNYSMSDPAAVSGTGGGAEPAPGHLRIWSKPASAQRTLADLLADGDNLRAEELGLSPTNRTATVWVEAVNSSAVAADGVIALRMNAGDGFIPVYDKVRTTLPAPPVTPTVSITATDPSAAEAGLDPAMFTVTRTGDLSSALVVPYTLSGTATNGGDYQTLSGNVTILAIAASQTFGVEPIQDIAPEDDETAIVTLTAPAGYILAGGPATVTIADDDLSSGDFVLTAAAVSSTDIDLTWTEVEGATRYELEISDGTEFFETTRLNGVATLARVEGLPASSHFEYRLTAYADAVSLGSSNTAGATTLDDPPAPAASAPTASAAAAASGTDHLVAFYGAGPIGANAFGNVWFREIVAQAGGTIRADGAPYPENDYIEALFTLLGRIDLDGDRTIAQNEVYSGSDAIDVKIVGYSFGGISAINLSRRLTDDVISWQGYPTYTLDVDVPVQSLVAIDPVNSTFLGLSWLIKHVNGPVKANVARYRGYWRTRTGAQMMNITLAGIPAGDPQDMGTPAGRLITGDFIKSRAPNTQIVNIDTQRASASIIHFQYPVSHPLYQGQAGDMTGSNVGHDTMPWYLFEEVRNELLEL
ncbi:MAG: hypothetical protein WBD40_13320 [Tepidisphaeraceae bacterium]